VTDAAAIAQKDLRQPYSSIDFDFRLYGEHPAAPEAEVERVRAAA
jgi:catechol 1,2-dioxygenase